MKLGQPVPLSNLVVDENKSCAQPAQVKVPERCSSLSGLLKGLSVPALVAEGKGCAPAALPIR